MSDLDFRKSIGDILRITGGLDLGRPIVLLHWSALKRVFLPDQTTLHQHDNYFSSMEQALANGMIFRIGALALGKHLVSAEFLKSIGESVDQVQIMIFDRFEHVQWIAISERDRKALLHGEAMKIASYAFEFRPPRSSGGQKKDVLEVQINLAFHVNVFAIVERLYHLIPLRDGKNRTPWATKEAALDDIYSELLALPWPKNDHHANFESQVKLMRTAYSNGRRRENWGRMFGCDDLRFAIAARMTSFSDARKADAEEEIRFQKTQFVALNKCRARAAEYRRTEHEISERGKQDLDPQLHQVMTLTANSTAPEVGEIIAAPWAGDFDPTPIYFRLEPHQEAFDLMCELGRIARETSAELSPQAMATLNGCRLAMKQKPGAFNGREHPDLMTMREFLAHAFAIYSHQRAG